MVENEESKVSRLPVAKVPLMNSGVQIPLQVTTKSVGLIMKDSTGIRLLLPAD